MTHADSTPAALAVRPRRAPMAVVACCAVLAFALPWQLRWGTVADTSWIITMCERLLAGERLYVDFVETNPPFTVWLYLPPVWLAQALGAAPEFLVHAYTYLACLAGLGLAAAIARRAGFEENPGLLTLAPAFLALLVVFPGNSFSEREHFGVALLLPLLALMAWRASNNAATRPSLAIALLAGLCGSVMLLVKPYYAVVILLPALYVAWRRRSVVALLAPEYWTIGLICVAYLALATWLYPEFLNDIYPVLADTYLKVRLPLPMLMGYAGAYLINLYLIRVVRPGVPLSPFVIVLAAASVAAIGPLLHQGKGWPYHAYPAVVLGIAALLCRLAQPSRRPLRTAHVLLVALSVVASAIPFLATQKPGSGFVDEVRMATDVIPGGPSVGLIGSDIAAGHPLSRLIGGRWSSAYCSDWLGFQAVYLEALARLDGLDEEASRYRAIAARYIDAKVAEIVAARPDVLLFQKQDQLWTARFLQDDRAAVLLSDYEFLAEDATLRVLIRRPGGR